MIQTLVTMWLTRWQALRDDKGASTVEYTILVAVGIVVATLVAGLVTTAVNTHSADIK